MCFKGFLVLNMWEKFLKTYVKETFFKDKFQVNTGKLSWNTEGEKFDFPDYFLLNSNKQSENLEIQTHFL